MLYSGMTALLIRNTTTVSSCLRVEKPLCIPLVKDKVYVNSTKYSYPITPFSKASTSCLVWFMNGGRLYTYS